ncbi:MAG: glyoxalase/bleomycin resistance/extradiol dioxygenase family protein [Pseudomonadota bacterium]
MSDPRQPNMSWIVPYLSVMDVEKAVSIYRDVFGFEVLETSTHGQDKVVHAELRYHDIVIMCGDIGMCKPDVKTPMMGGCSSPVTLYVYCEDVDTLYAKVKAQGLEIVYEIEDQFWGDRMFACKDLDGHAWSFGMHITK